MRPVDIERHNIIRSIWSLHQQWLCAICKRRPKQLCVDHDHLTNLVRGLLCLRCNNRLRNHTEEVMLRRLREALHPDCVCAQCDLVFARAAYIYLRTAPLRRKRLPKNLHHYYLVQAA